MTVKRCTFLLLAGLSVGCSAKPADPPVPAAASHETPAPAAASSTAVAAGSVETVQGPVLEVIDGGNYTYVRVKATSGDIWAATMKFPVAVGDTVIVPLENPMRDFRSPTMKREFALVYFASKITKPREMTAAPAGALPPGHPQVAQPTPGVGFSGSPNAMAAPEPNAKLIDPVPPAPGGTTIAKIWADRKSLAGKPVTVRGKIVKYNPEIMGLNWLHIQDGSGSVKDGTHDLTVTTNNDARNGDVVTITGTVVIDKNFGAGYGYAVMIQGAKVVK